MRYQNEATKNIAFPLGGIGSGSISLTGNGELNDWEIFNRPNKNTRNGYSHFAVKANFDGKQVVKILQGDTNENYIGIHTDRIHTGFGFGPRANSLAGFPHFKNLVFDGTFPIANLTFSDNDFPAVMRLTAFNPFIPHDSFNSSLPASFFEWEIENVSDYDVDFTLSFTVRNPAPSAINSPIKTSDSTGIFFGTELDENEIKYSDLTVLTDAENASTQACWFKGEWMDGIVTYWKQFNECEKMPERLQGENHGTLSTYAQLRAGEKKKIRFVLAWNVPNQYNYWSPLKDENGKDVTWKNYYATQFENSKQTAEYSLNNFSELLNKTQDFSSAIQNGSYPDFVKDAISSNLSVLKSSTVLRYEDGTFWAWEGVHETEGSCEGTCQHVWNYAYALPFLFPDLERTIRKATTKYALFPNGATNFRVPLPLGRETFEWSCVDGQMGEVFKTYREWKISGDDEWLKQQAPAVFKMLEYAWSKKNPNFWDRNKDGILEGWQHHTLDMDLYGPSSWLQGFYLLALDCASEMATALNLPKKANLYQRLYKRGKRWTNKNLFNGKFFCQQIDLTDKSATEGRPRYWNEETRQIKYQIGQGCVIDQVLADWHSALIGRGEIFDKRKKKKALKTLYKNNFKPSMRAVANTWRNFSVNDESGTIICSYPDGFAKPAIPITYAEETMTGFEYSLAGLMIKEGLIKEGERIVKAVRDRFDGKKRNPWNEFECGSNYARSMSSYALLLIYSGFTFDMNKKCVGFNPVNKGDFNSLWSVKNSWGEVDIKDNLTTFTVNGNPFTLNEFGLRAGEKAISVTVDGKAVEFSQENNNVLLNGVTIEKELVINK